MILAVVGQVDESEPDVAAVDGAEVDADVPVDVGAGIEAVEGGIDVPG